MGTEAVSCVPHCAHGSAPLSRVPQAHPGLWVSVCRQVGACKVSPPALVGRSPIHALLPRFQFALASAQWLPAEACVQQPPRSCTSSHPAAARRHTPTPSAWICHPAGSGSGMWGMKSGKMMKKRNLRSSCASHKPL